MNALQPFFGIAYFALGVVQFFAIADYIGDGVFAIIGAIILASIPIVGSIAGVLGAHEAWHWGWMPALALFFWWVPIIVIAMMMDAAKAK